MKLFILLIIVAFVCAFLFMRLRPYIQLARRILNIARDNGRNNINVNAAAPSATRAQAAAGKLSRCSTCGIWIPTSRALTLRSAAAVFCSHECLEQAASNTEPHSDERRKTGSRF
ncbi:MAG: hypothetical protein ACR2LC_06105 [Pyrinomonadaceae bacterium]